MGTGHRVWVCKGDEHLRSCFDPPPPHVPPGAGSQTGCRDREGPLQLLEDLGSQEGWHQHWLEGSPGTE